MQRFRTQMSILTEIGTTVLLQLLRMPLPPRLQLLPRTSTTHNGARLKQRTIGLLHDPGDRGALPQRSRTRRAPHAHCSRRPTQLKRGIKHAMGEQTTIRLNEVTSPRRWIEDLRAARGATSAPASRSSAGSDHGGNRARHPPSRTRTTCAAPTGRGRLTLAYALWLLRQPRRGPRSDPPPAPMEYLK